MNTIRHPGELAKLRELLPEWASWPDEIVQAVYSEWSERTLCAGWRAVAQLGSDELEELRALPYRPHCPTCTCSQ